MTKKERVERASNAGKKTVELYGKSYMSKLAKRMHKLRKAKIKNGKRRNKVIRKS